MTSLHNILLSSPKLEVLVSELAQVLETHIGNKSGLKGMAMKAGFSALRSAKPDIATRAVRGLLPDIAKALNPLFKEFRAQKSGDFADLLVQHAERASTSVVAAVDTRLTDSGNGTARAVYQRFRGSVGDELTSLLPAFGRVLSRHIA